MSIYVQPGVLGQIKTTSLPSGDLAVACPSSGPLEQLVFNICRWDGRRNQDYGGWIIPSSKAAKVRYALEQQCTKVAPGST